MYQGYKTERAFYNAKIYALAHTIYGEQANDLLHPILTGIISKRIQNEETLFNQTPGDSGNNSCSVLLLSDTEARSLYCELLGICKKVKANAKVTNAILGIQGNQMSDGQRKLIIKLTKYKFNWSAEVTFSKITEICPELAKRLTPWQIKNTKLLPLFNLMNKKQADKIVKRLGKIEERNKK